jgi:hypothetical protein
MMAALFILGAISLPLYVHVLAKVAARAWFREQLRYQNRFIQDLQKGS